MTSPAPTPAPAAPKPPFRCDLDADLFRRVALAVGREETRYYLTGVHVEAHPAGGAVMVATNGHVMLVAHDREARIEGGPAILKVGPRLLKACRAERALVCDGRRLGVTIGRFESFAQSLTTLADLGFGLVDVQWESCLIDGTFPDWRKIIGRELVAERQPMDATAVLAVDIRFQRLLCEALCRDGKEVSGGHNLRWRMVTTQKVQPVPLVAQGDLDTIFGMVMPRRCERKPMALPPWYLETFPPEPRASVLTGEAA